MGVCHHHQCYEEEDCGPEALVFPKSGTPWTLRDDRTIVVLAPETGRRWWFGMSAATVEAVPVVPKWTIKDAVSDGDEK